MKNILILLFLLSVLILKTYAQGELQDDEDVIAFRNERSLNLAFNTNGWGADFRFGTFINGFTSSIFQLEANTIKHEKEKKYSSVIDSKNRYAYGKVNTCFDVRAGFGIQRQLYNKKDVGSVEIRMYTVVGPVLAFMKPIYYNIKDTTERLEKYMPSHQPGIILGKAPFNVGLEETKLNPGGFARIGIGFEHGSYKRALRSLDIGASFTVYLREMELIADKTQNSRFAINLFISYRMGVFLYGRHLKHMNKDEEILQN